MRAYAFIVGSEDGPREALLDVARGLGFGGVSAFTTMAQAEQQMQSTPLCFFLFAATENIQSLRGIAEAVRFSAARRLRFSPLIYFAESPSVEVISACLNMGFDDIITMPFTRKRVLERVTRQVGQNLVYFETATYFGPDRRGRGGPAPDRSDKRTGAPFRRLEIVRNLVTGVNVLRDDQVAPEPV
jgi:CheY-like chemotaxis protein